MTGVPCNEFVDRERQTRAWVYIRDGSSGQLAQTHSTQMMTHLPDHDGH